MYCLCDMFENVRKVNTLFCLAAFYICFSNSKQA